MYSAKHDDTQIDAWFARYGVQLAEHESQTVEHKKQIAEHDKQTTKADIDAEVIMESAEVEVAGDVEEDHDRDGDASPLSRTSTETPD